MEVHVCRHRSSLAKEEIVHAKTKNRTGLKIVQDSKSFPSQKKDTKGQEEIQKRNRKRHDNTYNPTAHISDLTARWAQQTSFLSSFFDTKYKQNS